MGYKYLRGQSYQSRNKDKIEELTKEYTDRKFNYDPDTDAAYQEYARMMKESGQRAMEDTVGKASSLTGGYANSYASTVGQQTYNDYMKEAAAAHVDYYDRALARFTQEGSVLQDRINSLKAQESSDRAAWEEDYLADLEKMTITNDIDGLASIHGVTTDEYQRYLDNEAKRSLVAPTQEIIDKAVSEYMRKGYFEKEVADESELIENIIEKYVQMGYDPDALTTMLVEARSAYEYVKDRDWTKVSGKGKSARFQDQFGNLFFYDELENWTKSQSGEEEWNILKNKLKGLKKSSQED